MEDLKYGLKKVLKYSSFEVVVYKIAKEKYELLLLERSFYNNDEPFNYAGGIHTKLKTAKNLQQEMFNYMKENEFYNVIMRYCDLTN